jgi:hypothetical protein
MTTRFGRWQCLLLNVSFTTIAAGAWAAPARAQGAYQPCVQAGGALGTLCLNAVQAAGVVAARASLIAAGGNPATGSPSTLGLRLRSPRLAMAGRLTAARAELHPLIRADADPEDVTLFGYHLDATLGVYDGFAPAPTVGGVGSIDLIGSAGWVHLSEGDGFAGSVFTWGVGVRAGVMRESFNAPGVTLSAQYRRIASITYGDPGLTETAAAAKNDSPSLWSFRGVAGRLLGPVTATIGLGHDRVSSDAHVSVSRPGAPLTVDLDGFTTSRTIGFLNLSRTSLIYTIAAELGWQTGGEEPPAGLNAPNTNGKGALFGGLTLRLAF